MIRNLPQLQKLDNVVVQPDEVGDAMRRGVELIHPYDADESIPYTNYAPPTIGGPQSYQVRLLIWNGHKQKTTTLCTTPKITPYLMKCLDIIIPFLVDDLGA